MSEVNEDTATTANELAAMTSDMFSAYASNNHVALDQIDTVVQTIYASISNLGGAKVEVAPEPTYEPAVPVRSSIKSDRIISLIDGKGYKTLKRHLSRHGLTPEQYRERYNLKPDYPMVSAEYSKARSEMAKTIGLGTKGRSADTTEQKPKKAPAKRTRKAAEETVAEAA